MNSKIPLVKRDNYLLNAAKESKYAWVIMAYQSIGGNTTERCFVGMFEDTTDPEKFKLAATTAIIDAYKKNHTYGETLSFRDYCVKILFANYIGYYSLSNDDDEDVCETMFMHEVGDNIAAYIYTLLDLSVGTGSFPERVQLICEKQHYHNGNDHDIDIVISRRPVTAYQ